MDKDVALVIRMAATAQAFKEAMARAAVIAGEFEDAMQSLADALRDALEEEERKSDAESRKA